MSQFDEIQRLQAELDRLRSDSARTSWLLRRLFRKLRHAPRDALRRLKRSIGKRRGNVKTISASGVQVATTAVQDQTDAGFIAVQTAVVADFRSRSVQSPETEIFLRGISDFAHSGGPQRIYRELSKLEPAIGPYQADVPGLLGHWHDAEFDLLKKLLSRLPAEAFDSVILVPFGTVGGADFVAASLARALSSSGRVLILRTDRPVWERPDWYPENVPAVDLSDLFEVSRGREKLLSAALAAIGPSRIFNVNSRLAFDTFVQHAQRLSRHSKLYAYFFCADRTADGREVGYPVEYFAAILPHLQAAIFDTASLAEDMAARYCLPDGLRRKLRTIYTSVADETVLEAPPLGQVPVEPTRGRPLVLWAGRLDRQKRFDVLLSVAAQMPEVDFWCWGKAVLDAPTDMTALPPNVIFRDAFLGYNDLPLAQCDGWFYTSAWDGLPTILIELGARGVPIVAMDVGGVGELVTDETGWLVPPDSSVADMAATLREMIASPQRRAEKARRLQEKVRARHTPAAYIRAVADI